jgi:ABC-type multidrug transport system fused ATPase/permease subunit
MYVDFVVSASLAVCDQWGPVMEALGASERVISYLDAPAAPQIASGKPLPAFSGQVEFKDVSFRYPTRQEVLSLNQVSLTLQPGRLVALVGLSGSGKSTLVALLQRLYDANSGSILVDGKDITEVDAGEYRRQIGVVPQDPHLLSMSIADNIAYGLEEDGVSMDDIEAAAKMANAHDFIMAFPRGYRTMVTDKLLSGGQRQRIALARALVRNPRLLILDEATSALDATSEAQVQSALDRAMKETTRSCLVIAHRLVTVRNAHDILVMDRGQIVEQGSHDSLVAQGGIYAKMVARQTGGGLASNIDPTDSEESQDEEEAAAAVTSVVSVAETLEADNIVPLTPKREREGAAPVASTRSMESLEQLSLDAEDKPVDEMWRQGGGATHDLPDHAATRTP